MSETDLHEALLDHVGHGHSTYACNCGDRAIAALLADDAAELDVERLVAMADAAVGEVMTGNDYARYYKAIREHFRARLLRAAEYARLADPARRKRDEETA
jgi:hypothetical protein